MITQIQTRLLIADVDPVVSLMNVSGACSFAGNVAFSNVSGGDGKTGRYSIFIPVCS